MHSAPQQTCPEVLGLKMAARKCLLSLIQNEILCNFCQAPLAFFWG